jgi:hypothetical protein
MPQQAKDAVGPVLCRGKKMIFMTHRPGNFPAGTVPGELSDLSSGMGELVFSRSGFVAPIKRAKGAISDPISDRRSGFVLDDLLSCRASRAGLCRGKICFFGIFCEVDFLCGHALGEISGFSRRIGKKQLSRKPKSSDLQARRNPKSSTLPNSGSGLILRIFGTLDQRDKPHLVDTTVPDGVMGP